MAKITPRFFVLPLIALAVIAALPRPAAQSCAAAPAVAGLGSAPAGAPSCVAPSHVAVASATVLVR